MPHAQKACQKKYNNNKDAYPKEGMPHAHMACQKKREEKDSPHPSKIKKREGSCKGVHPPKKILTHLRILIRLYESFLLGSCF